MKYKDWVSEWLSDYVKPAVKEKTFMNYEGIMRIHVLPTLGEYELEELSLAVLQAFVLALGRRGNTRTGEGLAAGTVGMVVAVVQKSLRSAVQMERTAVQYSDGIKRPRPEGRDTTCFSLAEQKRIEAEVLRSPRSKNIGILICLYTGMRIGELMALRWDDIDFEQGIIRVSSTCRDGIRDGRTVKIIDSPKTFCSRRKIPIPIQIIPYLYQHKRCSRSEFVICSRTGDISVRGYQKGFSSMLLRLGIEHKSFHSLRHTFATRALECGMDVKTLSEILGHKSPTVTLNRYAHSMTEHKIAMMNRVGSFLQ